MISVIIPTLNAAAYLPACLAALMPATLSGLIRQVVISDGGSEDETLAITEASGADLVSSPPGRGAQLAAGAKAARGEWLLFLHADTSLVPGWEEEAAAFISGGDQERAGYFRLEFDSRRWQARAVEAGAALRCAVLRLPYGDQGLLISRAFYDRLGGYGDMPLFEDVDIVRRIRKEGQLVGLRARAVTSPERYEHDGYFARVIRNTRCLMAYYRGVPPAKILEQYQ